MDVVKEFFGAIGGRLRSHFIGSILISFLVFNWDSVLFLMMDGNSVWMKIAYIEKHWQLIWPIGVGLLVGFLNPWIIVGGAYVAKFPMEKLNSLQDGTKHERAMQQLEWESAENHEKAKLAKAVDEALKAIGDEDIRERLKEETSPSAHTESTAGRTLLNAFAESQSKSTELPHYSGLSSLEKNIIRRMGKRVGILLTIIQYGELPDPVQIDGQAAPEASLEEYKEAMSNLIAYNIAESKTPHENKISVFELTEVGLDVANALPRYSKK